MLHPFIPFITEEIYQNLPNTEKSITISSWPKVCDKYNDYNAVEAIDDMIEIITAIRNERAKANKAPSKPIDIKIYSKDENTKQMIKSTTNYLNKFTNPKNLEFLDNDLDAKDYSVTVLSMAKIYIPTSDLIDREEVIKKLLASKAKLEAELQRSEKMLSNESFISKAPKAKIDAEKAKQAEYKSQYDEILKSLKELGE